MWVMALCYIKTSPPSELMTMIRSTLYFFHPSIIFFALNSQGALLGGIPGGISLNDILPIDNILSLVNMLSPDNFYITIS